MSASRSEKRTLQARGTRNSSTGLRAGRAPFGRRSPAKPSVDDAARPTGPAWAVPQFARNRMVAGGIDPGQGVVRYAPPSSCQVRVLAEWAKRHSGRVALASCELLDLLGYRQGPENIGPPKKVPRPWDKRSYAISFQAVGALDARSDRSLDPHLCVHGMGSGAVP